MAKHDKNYDENEFYYVTNLLKKYKNRYKDDKEFKEILTYVKDQNLNPAQLIQEAASQLSIDQLVEAYSFAFKVAMLDGFLDEREEKILKEIQTHSKIPDRHYVSMLNRALIEIQDLQSVLVTMPYQDKEKRFEFIQNYFAREEILRCPKCKDTYLTTILIEDVKFDYCNDSCLGIWTDKGEFAASIAEYDHNMPYFKLDIVKNGKKTNHTCPRCADTSMYAVQFLEDDPTVVEMCPSCEGKWFDQKEFHEVRDYLNKKGYGGKIEVALSNLKAKGFKVL